MRFDWQPVPVSRLAARLREGAALPRLPGRTGRAETPGPVLVGINGHSSSGKTTLSRRLAAELDGAAVLHTDDLAWHQGVFAWDRLLLEDVLPVVRSGAAVDYRPPAWRQRDRAGAIELPAGLRVLLLEGVGASQATVRAELDVVVWVETDEPTRLERDAVRVQAGETSADSYRSWMAEENAYVTAEQPWRHADLVVYGGDSISHDRETEVVLATGGGVRPSG